MWHSVKASVVCDKLNTDFKKGLSQKESTRRLKSGGENKIEDEKRASIFSKFINQFKDFMVITLIISAIISAIVTNLQQSNDYVDSIIIILIVFFNALMGVIQESKAEKSIDSLKKMFSPTAKVIRSGDLCKIPASSVVIGDLIVLENGDLVPADIRLVSSSSLQVDESALTGEVIPVNKNSELCLNPETPMGDMKNMAFASTIVVNRPWYWYSN
ncbi:MAG: HAD-IC family P-type ATPase [Clostridia bacterium]|nr:HAD-IC family P-type ATPase [Clostridia bacterium]